MDRAASILKVFLVSMLPVAELRAGIPLGAAAGLPLAASYIAAVLGNLAPVVPAVLFSRRVLSWAAGLGGLPGRAASRLLRRGAEKGRAVGRYGAAGLVLLVAVPLPGTGAWTGALAAALLGMRLRRAFPAIVLGVLLAGAAVSAAAYGLAPLLF